MTLLIGVSDVIWAVIIGIVLYYVLPILLLAFVFLVIFLCLLVYDACKKDHKDYDGGGD